MFPINFVINFVFYLLFDQKYVVVKVAYNCKLKRITKQYNYAKLANFLIKSEV